MLFELFWTLDGPRVEGPDYARPFFFCGVEVGTWAYGRFSAMQMLCSLNAEGYASDSTTTDFNGAILKTLCDSYNQYEGGSKLGHPLQEVLSSRCGPLLEFTEAEYCKMLMLQVEYDEDDIDLRKMKED